MCKDGLYMLYMLYAECDFQFLHWVFIFIKLVQMHQSINIDVFLSPYTHTNNACNFMREIVITPVNTDVGYLHIFVIRGWLDRCMLDKSYCIYVVCIPGMIWVTGVKLNVNIVIVICFMTVISAVKCTILIIEFQTTNYLMWFLCSLHSCYQIIGVITLVM